LIFGTLNNVSFSASGNPHIAKIDGQKHGRGFSAKAELPKTATALCFAFSNFVEVD
jgi:hypothetical protein